MTGDSREKERAVSPVIGVILMVAITVILAAVIGAFVLEIGDQQETAPSASFESNEEVRTFFGAWDDGNCNPHCETNLTQVTVTHMGGDTMDITQMDIKVDGNDSAWGNPEKVDSYTGGMGYSPSDDPTIAPTPNIMRTWGSNDQVEFSSGQTYKVIGWNGLRPENIVPENRRAGTTQLQWAIRDANNYYCTEDDTGMVDGSSLGSPGTSHNPTIYVHFDRLNTGEGACIDDLDAGNDVSVVWSADSGGKTQSLFEYTVQQSNANQ